MDTDYILHRILRRIASWAVYSFFTEVRVIGGEKVPMNGPIIVYVSLSTFAQDLIQHACCTWVS
jgi:1-acyl-sn-glycerol-3-phosphate acyltransferase